MDVRLGLWVATISDQSPSQKVKEMNEMLAVVRKSLAEKRARLKEVVDKIDGLERMFAEKMEL